MPLHLAALEDVVEATDAVPAPEKMNNNSRGII